MPLTQTELDLVEAMYKANCDVKLVQQVLPKAVQSTLYRMRSNFDKYGSLHNPEKSRTKKPPPPPVEPKRPPPVLSDADRDAVQALFEHGCTVNNVLTWFPKANKSTLYRMRKNYKGYNQIRKPESARKKPGRPSCVTPEMRAWIMDKLESNKDMWHKDVAQELLDKFQVSVSRSTISRIVSDEKNPKECAVEGEEDEEEEEEDEEGSRQEPLDPRLR